jgi:MFS family permease
MGFVVDRWGLQRTIVLAYGVIAIGILLLTGAEALPVACVFAVVYGFAIGAPLLINPALTAECMGLANFGAVFGVLTLLNTVGAAVGAVLTGAVYDHVGGYLPAFVLFIVLTALAGSCGVLARRLRPLR